MIFVWLWQVCMMEYRPVTLVMRPIKRILKIYVGPQLQYAPKVGSAPRKPPLPRLAQRTLLTSVMKVKTFAPKWNSRRYLSLRSSLSFMVCLRFSRCVILKLISQQNGLNVTRKVTLTLTLTLTKVQMNICEANKVNFLSWSSVWSFTL